MGECLFDGKVPNGTPNEVHAFISCHCGEKVYLFGSRAFDMSSIQNPFLHVLSDPCMLEIANGKATAYPLDGSSSLKAFAKAFYYLGKDLFVIFSIPEGDNGMFATLQDFDHQLYQSIWKLNRKTKRLEKIFFRMIRFPGIRYFNISTSMIRSGYVLISGQQLADTSLVMRFIAANPLHVEQFPDIFMDKELDELKKKCIQRNLTIASMPYITADCLNFFAQHNDSMDSYVWLSKAIGKSQIQIFDIGGEEETKDFIPPNYLNKKLFPCNDHAAMWVPHVLYKPSPWKAACQDWTIWMCQQALRLIGKPLVWFGKLDNGYLASQFLRLYMYIICNILVPNIGPDPSLAFMVFSSENKLTRRYRVGNQMNFPVFTTNIACTTALNSDLLVLEALQIGSRLRITRFKNLFRVPKLLEIAYEMCKEMYPSTTNKLQDIPSFGGCNLFM